MHRSGLFRAAIAPTLAFAVFAGLTACRTGERAADTTKAGGDGQPGSVATAPDNGLTGRPGENPAATREYLMSLGWGDNLPRTAVAETAYSWDGDSATVRVVPSLTAHVVDWQEALGIDKPAGPGHFVARIYNLEDKTITPLGLGAFETGYLWVGEVPGAPGGRGAAIYRIRNDGAVVGTPALLRVVGFCPGQHSEPSVEITDGRKCEGAAASASDAPRILLASNAVNLQRVGRGIWVSCSAGCCEVRAEQF